MNPTLMRTRQATALLLFAWSVCAIAIGTSNAEAQATLIVDRGSLGGTCSDAYSVDQASSPAAPWCSIPRAIEAAPSGSTIRVRSGSYPKLDIREAGHRSSMVTLAPHPGDHVEIAGAQLYDVRLLRFRGFRFVDNVDVRYTDTIEFIGNELPGKTLWFMGTSETLVADNHIHDVSVANGRTIGVRFIGDSDLVVRNNLIEDLVEDPIQLSQVTGGLVEGNTLLNAHPVSGQHTDTIHVLGADDLTIANNYARNIAHGLMFTNFPANDVTIVNNVVSRITNGLALNAYAGGMAGLRLLSNTFWESPYGVQFRRAHPNAVIRNNIFEKVDGLGVQPVAEYNLVARPAANTDYGEAALLSDPQFTDASVGDFELTSSSPAIDAGIDADGPIADQKGRVYRDEMTVPNIGFGPEPFHDLGALEFGYQSALPHHHPQPVPKHLQWEPAISTAPRAVGVPHVRNARAAIAALRRAELRVAAHRKLRPSRVLAGSTLKKQAYIFLPKRMGIKRIRYFIDEQPNGSPSHTRRRNGALAKRSRLGKTLRLSTNRLCNGRHYMIALIDTHHGTVSIRSNFKTYNGTRRICTKR